MIDPDGPNNGVEPFEVYCNMGTGKTEKQKMSQIYLWLWELILNEYEIFGCATSMSLLSMDPKMK